uniref:Uncharacterized protein n=1 Tax=Siphoviridae sp. ctqED62 TaxID=2826468 RepID=A0A8S5MR90_9CAUD|nr:MAG TPA: hypothetical protein [Siphoviridae sp. ctqED62]
MDGICKNYVPSHSLKRNSLEYSMFQRVLMFCMYFALQLLIK